MKKNSKSKKSEDFELIAKALRDNTPQPKREPVRTDTLRIKQDGKN